MKRQLSLATASLCSMATTFVQYGGCGAKSKRVFCSMRFLFAFLLSICFSIVYAKPVTEQQALQKAQNFLKDKRLQTKNVRRASKAGQQQSTAQEDFYIFNVEDNGGFVIVSGDDRTEEILGYSDEGHIDIDNMPDNMRSWLEEVKSGISLLDNSEYKQRKKIVNIPKIIDPLIKTKWAQGEPYNWMCPKQDGVYCLTGCGPTAISQIMYYHKKPDGNTFDIPGYNSQPLKIDLPALPPTTFNWENMKAEYINNEFTQEEGFAVAELMCYCGQLSLAHYSSSITNSGLPIETMGVLGYEMSRNVRDKYTNEKWDSLLVNELAEGRPFVYYGSNGGSGHFFVIDGYDGDGHFHINWGWGGSADGFYNISSPSSYTMSQGAYFMYPLKEMVPFALIGYFSFDYHRKESQDNFFIPIDFVDYRGKEDIPTKVEIFENSVLKKTIFCENGSFSFGANINKGIYVAKFYYLDEINNVWCDFKNYNCCNIEILDNNLSLSTKTTIYEPNNDADKIEIKNIKVFKDINGFYHLNAEINNVGDGHEQPFFLWINNNRIASKSTWIDPGQSGELQMIFSLPSKGDYVLKLTNDNEGKLLLYTQELSNINDDIEVDGICYNFDSHNKTAEITKKPNKYSGNVIIPEEVDYNGNTYTVTSVGAQVFKYCSDLMSITIPNSVKSIGQQAFYGCSSLSSITISNAITTIEEGTFLFCSGLTSIVIPNSVTNIGREAFSSCTGLTSIAIPNSVTSIGDEAFSFCLFLPSIEIPQSVTSIGKKAFLNCNHLTSVTISSSVTSIGDEAFSDCRGLTSIEIPQGVKTIGQKVFSNCPKLTDVYCYAKSVPTTSHNSFDGSNIENVTLHVPVQSISAYQATEPWSGFKSIIALTDSDPNLEPKCATPTIAFVNGKVSFSCETDGVEYVYKCTTPSSTPETSGNEFTPSTKYVVTVYAKKEGYLNSQPATAEIDISGIKGDVNGDGVVDIADAVKIVNMVVGKVETLSRKSLEVR